MASCSEPKHQNSSRCFGYRRRNCVRSDVYDGLRLRHWLS
ncbi:hypothetical protein GXM_01666 [Nostoc sphaeroides CCNUC1]|uniref:Uncharacterized protein n=1 Tax=Nostoc sphaeroides CCNUC1 TaxID=2653204 RepID=A0A5P8VUU6_9NOSO|nr:hypothetical protein GXM_01666 [Nostoc sphaeroides CCNUC1]